MIKLFDEKTELKVTKKKNGDSAINQTQSREIKNMLLDSVKETIAATYGNEIMRTDEGLGIIIPNEIEGSFIAMLDIKIKSLDYDIDTAATDYADKLKAKKEKADKKAATAK